MSSSKGCITTDQIDPLFILHKLYNNLDLQQHVESLLDVEALHPYEYKDPLSSIDVHYYTNTGRELGWDGFVAQDDADSGGLGADVNRFKVHQRTGCEAFGGSTAKFLWVHTGVNPMFYIGSVPYIFNRILITSVYSEDTNLITNTNTTRK